MQIVILCGGKGTRAYPYTDYLPKPMLPINGQPIVMHVMRIFAEQGHKEFILSLGYRKEVIMDYFHQKMMDWDVQLVDTGDDTDTGGRIEKCKHLLGDTFMATYSDGLSDIQFDKLLQFHNSHEGLATVTSVPLRSQYGTIDCDASGMIVGFREKPVLYEHWINAGFFVFNRDVFDHWAGNNLEQDVFPGLVQKKLLYAYQHDGFFKSMDTYKDQQEIEMMARNGNMEWQTRRQVVQNDKK
jgi:glucose-1-phosphate cytidylyltransferase